MKYNKSRYIYVVCHLIAKAGMLHSFLVTQSTHRVIFPTSRENICPSGQAKFYVILKVIPSELVWWIQKNGTRWRERLFSLPFFVTEENTLFFVWLKANNQPIPTKLTFYRRALVEGLSGWWLLRLTVKILAILHLSLIFTRHTSDG